ncbi:MAG TPA: hypothetical protein DEA27_03785 [Candidatus Moranbacteria bacterium]|nr:hypothetical protein [Candidatus Moranbacteria bacterium]
MKKGYLEEVKGKLEGMVLSLQEKDIPKEEGAYRLLLQKRKAGDYADRSDPMSLCLAEVTLNEKKILLRKCLEALKRIDDGTYGICECGDKITQKRLLSNPHVSTCLECQKATERKNRIAGKEFHSYLQQPPPAEMRF